MSRIAPYSRQRYIEGWLATSAGRHELAGLPPRLAARDERQRLAHRPRFEELAGRHQSQEAVW